MPVWNHVRPPKSPQQQQEEEEEEEELHAMRRQGEAWECPSCTFFNEGGPLCEMCETRSPIQARPPPPPPVSSSEQKGAPPKEIDNTRRVYGDLYVVVHVIFPPRDQLKKMTAEDKVKLRSALAALSDDAEGESPRGSMELPSREVPLLNITVDDPTPATVHLAEPLEQFQASHAPLNLAFPPPISKEQMLAGAYDDESRDRDIFDSVKHRKREFGENYWQDYLVDEVWRGWLRRARDPVLRSEEEGDAPGCRTQ